MKICFITPSTGTIQGGGETTVRQFAAHLSKKHEVVLLTGRSSHIPMQKEISNAPYEVLTAPYWPRFTPKNNLATKLIGRLDSYKTESLSFYYNIQLRSKIKEKIKNMDVISTHYRLDSKLFSNLAYKFGVPSVFHILGGAYSKAFFEKDRSSMYIATDPLTKELLESKHEMEIDHVVTPGIPSQVLSRPKEESSLTQKKLLFVGRLQRSKGLFGLIEIFRRLSESEDDISLTIVGDGNILDELKEKVKKLDMQNKINFQGSIPYEDVFEQYLESSLFVFPSKMETFGMVPLEAMASGLPVVTSNIPPLKNATGGNALLIPPDDMNKWVDGIKSLLTDIDKMKKMSENGREWATQFTWENKAEEYEKCLYEVVEKFKNTGK